MAGTEMDLMPFVSARRRPFSRHLWRCALSDDPVTRWMIFFTAKHPPLVITAEPGLFLPICLHSCCTWRPLFTAIILLSCPKLYMSMSEPITFTMASVVSWVISPWMTSTSIPPGVLSVFRAVLVGFRNFIASWLKASIRAWSLW